MSDRSDEVFQVEGSSASGTLFAGGTMRLASAGIGIVGGLVVSVSLVRELGVFRFGVYAFVISVVGLAGVLADAGVGNSISRMSSYLRGEAARSWARGSLKVAATTGGLLTVATLLCVPIVPDSTRAPLALATPLILLASLRAAEGGVFSARRQVVLLEGVSIATQLGVYASALLIVYLVAEPTVEMVLAAQVVVRAVGVAILGVAWWRLETGQPRTDRTGVREILAFSIPLLLGAAAAMVLQRSDVVLLGLIDGPGAAGEYAPLLRVFDVSMVVVSAVGYYFFSVGASLVRDGDMPRLRNAFVSVTKWAMVFTIPLLLTMLIVPEPVMVTLYGREFADTALVARVLAIGFIANVVTGVNGGALVALGATRQIAIRSVVLMVSNILLNVLLIPAFGTLGAALATTAVTLALNVVNSTLIWRMARLGPARRDTVSFSIATIGAAAAATAIVWVIGAQDALVGAIVIWVATFASGGIVAVVTIRPEERRMATALIERIRSG